MLVHCPARHLLCRTAVCLSHGVCVSPENPCPDTPGAPMSVLKDSPAPPQQCWEAAEPQVPHAQLPRLFLPLGSSCVLVPYPLCGAALSPHHKPSGQPCSHTTSPGKRPCPHIMCPLRKGPVSTPHPLRDSPVASKHPQRTAPATYNIPLWGTASDSCLDSACSLRSHPVPTHGIAVR